MAAFATNVDSAVLSSQDDTVNYKTHTHSRPEEGSNLGQLPPPPMEFKHDEFIRCSAVPVQNTLKSSFASYTLKSKTPKKSRKFSFAPNAADTLALLDVN